MRIAFCVPGFNVRKLSLQPWLTVDRVASKLAASGHDVHVVTDCASGPVPEYVAIHSVKTLRGTNSAEVCHVLSKIKPERVVVSVTPLSLLTTGWYRELASFRSSFAYVSYPFYSGMQILRALPHLGSRDRLEYGRHVMVPRWLWADRLVKSYRGVISQSEPTGQTLLRATSFRIPVYVIPPGVDRQHWVGGENDKAKAGDLVCLYVGTASKIRGFFVALDALARIKDTGIRLRVLARGADTLSLDELSAHVARRGIGDRVTIRGGWLDPMDIRKEVQAASLVLLPFVLVPSELPVSVLEAVCAQTPVVVSDIDGLADAAGQAGIVVPQASAVGLANAIQALRKDNERLKALRAACIVRREQVMDWDAVATHWEAVLTE